MAYDRNPGIGLDVSRPQFRGATAWRGVYMVALPVSMLSLALYWLSLPLRVYLQARARGERAWLWAALALGGNLLGVVTFLLMRRARRSACPACGSEVTLAQNACPHCGLARRASCPTCHEPLDEGWRFCPRCAAEIPGA